MSVNELDNLGDIRAMVYEMIEEDESSTFWPPATVNGFIFAEHQGLVSKIIEAYEKFFAVNSTADIVANQEFYGFPSGFRKLMLLEQRSAAGQNSWTNITPITDSLEDRAKYGSARGRGTSGVDFRDRSASLAHYHLWGGGFMLVPFFNYDMAAGLRMWWISEPMRPRAWTLLGNQEDAWVPFNGLLTGHHEILAVGAAIRCKNREENPDSWGPLYSLLWRTMGNSIENRQVQSPKHGTNREGYYNR